MFDLLEAPGEYDRILPAGLRRCSTCGDMKPIEEFPIKNKATGLRRSQCRACRRAYGREHYERNRPSYVSRAKDRRKSERPRIRALVDEFLRSHPCVDCGCPIITVLEFDHRDPGEKSLTVARLKMSGTVSSIRREIEKCDVRCANCHRRRTAAQFQYAKVKGVTVESSQVRPGQTGRYAPLPAPRQDPLFSPEPHGLRQCSRCSELRALYEFRCRDLRSGAKGYYCRRCRAEYRRGHYLRNKDDYIRRAIKEVRLLRQDVLLQLHSYLRSHPCIDCGESDITVLEFDHIDPASKSMDIGAMIGRRSWAKILAEIEKCVVRCANCHRKRTARQQGWKARLAEAQARYARIRRIAGVA